MKFSTIAAVNNELTLESNLAASPLFKQGVDLILKRGYRSASLAYNDGLEETDADIVIFAHQDVYLPSPWLVQITKAIKEIEIIDSCWAVIGVFGISRDVEYAGHCWSTGLGRTLGTPFDKPVPAVAIDELVIIINKASGVQFDVRLPGFHLYGTDIVQIARTLGRNSYIVHAPVIHNSKPVKSLIGPYVSAYRYMQKKWEGQLPIMTPVSTITRFGLPLFRVQLRLILKRIFSKNQSDFRASPERGREIAKRLGLEA